jgi:hypothetical protein
MRPSPRPSNWASFLLSVHSSILIVGKKAGCGKRTQTRIKITNVVCKELHVSIQRSPLPQGFRENCLELKLQQSLRVKQIMLCW